MENLKELLAANLREAWARCLPYAYGFAAGVVVGWLL